MEGKIRLPKDSPAGSGKRALKKRATRSVDTDKPSFVSSERRRADKRRG